jgi:L-galactose dehydrogenase/L-glyceraldehyde 3-phosphate reductase
METRTFGRTGLEVSRLTFGCGAVGGLMTKGAANDQDRAVAWARDQGINFFDTAASYGNGASETNLGRALAGNSDGLIISTKAGLGPHDMHNIGGAIATSLDASLARLKLDHVDLFQFHNTIGHPDHRGVIELDQVMGEVLEAFEHARDAGKTRFIGFTAKGEPNDLSSMVKSERFDSAQIFYNLLVPSAGEAVAADYPADDFKQLLTVARAHGVGSIGVRVLAGGALSGHIRRHPLGMPNVAPIGSDTDYATDAQRALRFQQLVDAGYASDLPSLAIRYVISHADLCTTEIGIATLDEVKHATKAINEGPLPSEALVEIANIQRSLSA